MRSKLKRSKRLIFLSIALLMIGSVVAVAVSNRIRQKTQQKRGATLLKPECVTALPEVFSNVKDLQIAGARIVRPGTPEAEIAIDIINSSDHAVMALEISSGDNNDWSSWGQDGLADPDDPQVVIPAHTLKTFEWRLAAILEGSPVVISGASFANGTEDGDPLTLEVMHRGRERSKAERNAAKKGVRQ